ncbi:MAG: DNA-3-methyladenine glycosylase [Planctomycetota bacterium]
MLLARSDFAVDPVTLAKALLGQRLVRVLDGERVSGRIVETEAYCGVEDKAAHSVGWRRTTRTEPMFARAGTSYVFLTYGMHHCFNVVCGALNEGVDEPVAVLVRAVEPVEGLETMRRLRAEPASRNARRRDPAEIRDRDLCSGPAKLCRAMAIDRGLNGVDLVSHEDVWLERSTGPGVDASVVHCARIGVEYAGEWAGRLLRWYVEDSPHVSVRVKSGFVGESGPDKPRRVRLRIGS